MQRASFLLLVTSLIVYDNNFPQKQRLVLKLAVAAKGQPKKSWQWQLTLLLLFLRFFASCFFTFLYFFLSG